MKTPLDRWRGLPFASIAHRFAAPEEIILDAAPAPGGEFGAAPWQIPFPDFALGAPQGDDCLSLNVWAPRDAAGLPVLLWFYGGGFEAGAASAPLFDGADAAARAEAVIITANYRVGAYGFASLAHHGGALAHATNLGLRDAIAAYRWSCRHVSFFGGDPGRITVAGQSAGGFLSAALATAPEVAPPAAVACFSGGASRVIDEEVAHSLGDALLAELGLAQHPEDILLRAPEEVLEAQNRVIPRDLGVRNGPSPRAFGIAIDAAADAPVVPVHPAQRIADGVLRHTFVLSSATDEEALGFDPVAVSAASAAQVEAEAESFAQGARHPVAEYTASRFSPSLQRARLLTDYVYRLPAARLVASQRESGGHAALLRIGTAGTEPAGHGCELEALFAHTRTARDEAVWAAFAAVIGEGTVSGGAVDAPLAAGEPSAAALDPVDVVTLWDGVERP